MPTTVAAIGSRVRALLGELPHLPGALRLVWVAARRWAELWFVLLLVQGVLPVALVYLTRALVDRLVGAVDAGGGWEAVRGPLLLALLMAALLLVGELLRAATRAVRTAMSELVSDHVSGLIHERAVAADLAHYESPDYHDLLYRARIDAQHRPMALVENLGQLLQSGLTLLAMAAVLVPFGWWVPLALVASTAPALWVVLRFAVREHEWQEQSTAARRRAWYYSWLLTSREGAPELRLFGLGGCFARAFDRVRSALRNERIALAREAAIAEIVAAAIGVVVLGATLGLMVVRALGGGMSLGELAMFYQAFSQGQRLLRSLLETVGQIYSNALFLGNLFELLGLRPEVTDPEQPLAAPGRLERGIAFKAVTFAYPSSLRPVLDHFELEVRVGELVALLGPNGSGKSTLFKLLCRLYDPQQGRIEIDGVDLRRFALADLRRLITILFQTPVHYSETLRRNVELGAPAAQSGGARLAAAVEAAGASRLVGRLPEGLETLLGTWFEGGVELSVGEWQRVALARAALREAEIVLLDEPTSAMDSWAEAEWLGRFRRLAKGRTTIVITHRLSTARVADTIHVVEGGRVVESGSHRELVEAGGRYAAAWAAQVGADG